jgi:hypothetical protein
MIEKQNLDSDATEPCDQNSSLCQITDCQDENWYSELQIIK